MKSAIQLPKDFFELHPFVEKALSRPNKIDVDLFETELSNLTEVFQKNEI